MTIIMEPSILGEW